MIKIIALDIYGTILASDDVEGGIAPRKGLEEFFEKCKRKNIKIVSTSDAYITNVKIDLEESGVKLENFDGFYELKENPKNFSIVVDACGILPEELLVIGDSDKDEFGAKLYNNCFQRVPEYRLEKKDDFNLNEIEF